MSNPTNSTDSISALQQLTDTAVQGEMQSDAELLQLFVESGSRAAIEAIIHRYAGMVASVCRCTISDPASAEDAFQATFLVLLKSAKKIQNRRSLAAWLHGVAYRTACRLRKQRLVDAFPEGPDEVIADHASDEDPIFALARKLELEALDQELEKLPQGLREILVEHYLLGYTAPQIAARTALTVSAVEGRIRRGRYTLLRQLAKRGVSLTVLVAASTWFQQHLQAAQCSEWTETFLESYLPQDAPSWELQPNSDISSLVQGEMNMMKISFLKTAVSAGATLLLGGLISFNLYGDGGQTGRAGEMPETSGLTMQTLPDETEMVVAQIGAPNLATNASTISPSSRPETNEPKPQDKETTIESPPVTTADGQPITGPVTGLAIDKSKNLTREPIQWQVADSEPPEWLQTSDEEGEFSEQELQEQVRAKLRKPIDVNMVRLPLRQAMQQVEEMTEIKILIDTNELAVAGIDPESPVSVDGEMSVREFLRRAFKSIENADAGLAYTVNENSIEITSKEGADREPGIRYYDLAFVLPNDSHLVSVVSAIQQTIYPDSWVMSGGSNTISPVGSMLIIACPESAHQKIETMLARVAAINKSNLQKTTQPFQAAPTQVGVMGGMGGGMGGMGGGGGMF